MFLNSEWSEERIGFILSPKFVSFFYKPIPLKKLGSCVFSLTWGAKSSKTRLCARHHSQSLRARFVGLTVVCRDEWRRHAIKLGTGSATPRRARRTVVVGWRVGGWGGKSEAADREARSLLTPPCVRARALASLGGRPPPAAERNSFATPHRYQLVSPACPPAAGVRCGGGDDDDRNATAATAAYYYYAYGTRVRRKLDNATRHLSGIERQPSSSSRPKR